MNRPLSLLRGILYTGCLSVLPTLALGFNAQSAQSQVNPDGFTRFADWCEHRDQLAASARHTVEVLLTQTETEDCDRADTILSSSTDLHLSNHQISDLAPLAPLTSLQELNLAVNQIVDIEPLANLTQLQRLSLNGNQIVDVAPLANLTQLQRLWLSENQIVDVAPLAALTQLYELHLDGNQIVDVAPLAALTNLKTLNLWGNPLVDHNCPVEPISTCVYDQSPPILE